MYEDCLLCDLERNVNTSLFWIDVEETPNYFANFTTNFQKDDLFTASFVQLLMLWVSLEEDEFQLKKSVFFSAYVCLNTVLLTKYAF